MYVCMYVCLYVCMYVRMCDVFTGMFAMLSYTVVTLDVGHCI